MSEPSRTTLEMSRETVNQVLDERVRPALMMDGGNIELLEVKDRRVFVRLVGACGSCPSSQMTLKGGVERTLREVFADMVALVAL